MVFGSGRLLGIAFGSILLAGVMGCAHKPLAGGDASDGTLPSVVLREVKVSADGLLVDIYADRPLTYTSYKISSPPKTVIDLAQTEPGDITAPIEVNRGNIRQILVTKHGYGSGFLSRVEIMQERDEDAVVTPLGERDRLQVKYSDPSADAAEAKYSAPAAVPSPEIKADASADPVQTPSSAEVTPQAQKEPSAGEDAGAKGTGIALQKETGSVVAPPPVAQPPVAVPSEAPATETDKPGEKPSAQSPESAEKQKPGLQGKNLSAVRKVRDGIEIDLSDVPEKVATFRLAKPDRMVIDLFGITRASASRVVPINNFGVANARIGLTPEKVRVVLDAAGEHLPPGQVVTRQGGLKVVLEQLPERKQRESAVEKTAPAPVPPGQARPAEPAVPVVENVEFKQVDGYSRVSIVLDEACKVGEPTKSPRGWLLTIDNCQVPRKLQRMLDARSFVTPVLSITPYQVTSKGRKMARILVKMRSAAPFTIKQEGRTVNWDFKNSEAGEQPSFMSDVVRDQYEASPVAEQPQSVTVAGDGKRYTGRRVSLEFSDADIRKIFQLIAEVSNLNFLISDDVTGTISLRLVNVPWDQALDVILESKGLEMKRDGNIVQIKPAGKFKSMEQGEQESKRARERAMELQTVIFDINYASVGDVVAQLNNLKTSREGVSISQDARTNRVIVTDIAPALEKMKSLLKNIDIPERQVMIEARIVEATSTFTRELGIQWGIHYRDGSGAFLEQLDTGFGGIVIPPPSTGTSGPGAAIGMSFGRLTSNVQLDLRLSAAATNGQIKIISTPKVVTLNNKAAKISQGQSIPYQTVSAEGTKTEFVEAALTLEVTPHITADGNIGMKIKASNNSAGTGSPPPINKKEATTELQIRNGETTVIGGIYVDGDTEEDRGVPFLQDIPLFGWLFKSNTKTKTKTELLIFITPRIVG
ncbi:type IV pilus secretin family protein [Geobacter sp. DSM 9736]|uniref:type IV pilus secretin family protein n=1 Tax=Geobacter sp. DSM 9736 TaxID=1277350 RepID=UPI000B6078B5|nr:type IV pilus secretin family protein [Geobacter sp. DSM 9736]SNB46188.1 type IV pilus assembly protein PilQ [Geobacter sp. DSM 9736]